MPRDSNGNYTLPAGNPVVSGTVIESVWANTTMEDVAEALTNSLDRYGNGGMLAPFAFADGSRFAPGATWLNEQTSGLYRGAEGDLRISILTQDVMRWRQSGVQIWDVGAQVWRGLVIEGTEGTVPPGGTDPVANDGETLRWNVTSEAWEATGLLRVPQADSEVLVDGPFRISTGGTASSTAILEASPTGTAGLYLGDTDDQDIGAIIYDNSDDTLNFQTANAVAVTIDAAGQVGIGTSSPATALDVVGQAQTDLGLVPGITGAQRIAVVAALPPTPDPNTIYFVTS